MKRHSGFTLIEVLIVVVIMAVLAATIIPQFADSTSDAKQSQLDFNIHAMRSQIELYKIQHGGSYPAITSNSLPGLVGKTDADGTLNASGAYGPYIADALPNNPDTDSNSVSASTDGSEQTGGGWLYNVSTGQVWADSAAPSS